MRKETPKGGSSDEDSDEDQVKESEDETLSNNKTKESEAEDKNEPLKLTDTILNLHDGKQGCMPGQPKGVLQADVADNKMFTPNV